MRIFDRIAWFFIVSALFELRIGIELYGDDALLNFQVNSYRKIMTQLLQYKFFAIACLFAAICAGFLGVDQTPGGNAQGGKKIPRLQRHVSPSEDLAPPAIDHAPPSEDKDELWNKRD